MTIQKYELPNGGVNFHCKLPRQTSWPIPKGTSLTTGRVLRRPQHQYGAAPVADFCTTAYTGLLTADEFGISATNNYVVTPEGGRPLGGFRHEWHVVG